MYITDGRKHIITEPKRIIERWLGHFKHLLNIENERDGNMTEVPPKRGLAAHYHIAIRISGSSEANVENAEQQSMWSRWSTNRKSEISR